MFSKAQQPAAAGKQANPAFPRSKTASKYLRLALAAAAAAAVIGLAGGGQRSVHADPPPPDQATPQAYAPIEDAGVVQSAPDQLSADAAASISAGTANPVANILCKFPDITVEPNTAAYVQSMFGTNFRGLDGFFQEMSYNAINLTGTESHGWYTMPHPRTYYSNISTQWGALLNDCASAAGSDINLSQFSSINA